MLLKVDRRRHASALPMPAVPPAILSWFAFTQAISSLRSFAGTSAWSTMSCGLAGEQRDRLEILQQVVAERIDRAVDDVRAQWPMPIV